MGFLQRFRPKPRETNELLFQAHLEAAGGGDWTDARRASALVSALGREGQRKYFADEEQEAARQLTSAASASSEAARQSTGAASTSSDAVPPASEFPRLLQRLDRLFAASTIVLAERHEFASRKQFEGQGFLEFVTALKEKAVQCNFDTTYDERIRDQIIHGVANVSVREKLLAHGETLSLDKAEEIGRSLEALHRANRAFDSEKIQRIEAAQLGAPSTSQDGRLLSGSRQDGRRLPRGRPDDRHFAHGSSGNRGACDRCGSTKHIATYKNCPARNRRCNACHTLGHFASVCLKTRTVQHVSYTETLSSTSAGQPSASVLTVSTLEAKRDLQVPVVVNDVAIRLLVDTGASVSLMTAEDFGKHFGRQHRLSKTAVDLRNYSKQRIDIQGLFQATVQFFQRSCSVTFHVTSTGTSLLGLDAIQRLGIQIDGTSLTCCLAMLPPVQSPTGVPPGFDHLFSGELGLVKNFVDRIHRRRGMKPVSSKLRRLPLALREQVTNELRRLEDCDVIERVEASEWVSPLVVVRKKDGAIQLCVDLREPNKAIVIDGYPLPHVEELLQMFHGATYFSKLDLASAYHQLLLEEGSRDLTTFITHEGLFRFKRVCFGLASAPAVFQKMMSQILQSCKNVVCYLDDILVWGRTKPEHDANLREVLLCISNSGMKLNEKCVFVRELTFLGHKISAEGISPTESKVKAILNAPAPTDIKSLQSFLGLAGYYAKFIDHYAELVEPLRLMLRQGQNFAWSDDAQRSFNQLKARLACSPVIKIFNPELPVVVTTDASDVGVGAVLQQQYGSKLKTVAFASRTLSVAERKYSVGEREALACLFACEKWHVYLWGRRFTLRTDHQAVVALLSAGDSGRRPLRISRWSARLLYYNFQIEYCIGSENLVADALSRLPVKDSQNVVQEQGIVSLVTSVDDKETVQLATSTDETLQKVSKCLAEGWPSRKNIGNALIAYTPVTRAPANSIELLRL
ncbi:uncharacterized protein [Dermacentor albipictus]|uniref:uncharacterized protein n=1 Tax=Dermacentor albipictus TaxID=60249 RepID=UPI0038FCA940